MQDWKTVLPMAAGAYLGVRASEFVGKGGLVGVGLAIVGAYVGIKIAKAVT